MSAPAVLDVEQIIDRNGVGRFQRRVLLICFGVLVVGMTKPRTTEVIARVAA